MKAEQKIEFEKKILPRALKIIHEENIRRINSAYGPESIERRLKQIKESRQDIFRQHLLNAKLELIAKYPAEYLTATIETRM